jgi:hypothetical protein
LFGRFNFVLSPTPDNPERIEILDNWIEDNIVTLNIPELDNCLFAEGNTYTVQPVGRIRCHKLAAPKFMQLFAQWHAADLIDRVITCAGAFSPRLIRGSTSAKVDPICRTMHGVLRWTSTMGRIPANMSQSRSTPGDVCVSWSISRTRSASSGAAISSPSMECTSS